MKKKKLVTLHEKFAAYKEAYLKWMYWKKRAKHLERLIWPKNK